MLLSFLNSLRQQKEAEIWNSQNPFAQKTDTQARVEIAVMVAQRNLLAMIENLPNAIQMFEDQIATQNRKVTEFKKAQE